MNQRLTNKKILNYFLSGGHRPLTMGAHVAHFTRLNNLFLGNPECDR
ncbi:MAG: hypothetical protein V7L21_09220 [Nostoc sp.]|nr:hypothetical protein [Nostoc sp. NMS9]MBN3944254.1 hypothetical protein [Nostoc sp. NMS9]